MNRKTKNITLVVLTAFAAVACDEAKPVNTEDNQDIKHCVDQDGVVQDESKCANVSDNRQPPQPLPDGGTTHVTHVHSPGGYFWHYGGTRTTPGTRVTGGSYSPSPGKVYAPPSRAPISSPPSISRGGFGATGGGSC